MLGCSVINSFLVVWSVPFCSPWVTFSWRIITFFFCELVYFFFYYFKHSFSSHFFFMLFCIRCYSYSVFLPLHKSLIIPNIFYLIETLSTIIFLKLYYPPLIITWNLLYFRIILNLMANNIGILVSRNFQPFLCHVFCLLMYGFYTFVWK